VKWSITDSRQCREWAGEIVVCGAASMPRMPPRRAHSTSTSSGFIRDVGHTDRAPAWVMNTGTADGSMVGLRTGGPAGQ
jgi:hypothetical protein